MDVYSNKRATKDCHENVEISSKGRIAGYSSITIFSLTFRNKSISRRSKEKTCLICKIVMKAYSDHSLPVTILRPAVVFGPGSFSWGVEDASLIYERRFALLGGGQFRSGVVYIDDVVDARIFQNIPLI